MNTNGVNELTTILIADELTLLREGMSVILEATGRFKVVAQCDDGEAAMETIKTLRPDVAILDFNLSKLFSLEIARRVREESPGTRVVMLSNRCDRKSVTEALRAGVCAFLPKMSPSHQLIEALDYTESSQGTYVSPLVEIEASNGVEAAEPVDAFETLSPREFQVFSLMVEGVRAKEIAVRLRLSPKTVDTYRSNLMRKLGIHDLAGLVKFAIARELTSMH